MAWRFPLRPPIVITPKPVVVAPPPPPPPPEPEEVVEVIEEPAAVVAPPVLILRWLFWRATLWLLIALGIQTLASLMPQVIEFGYSQRAYLYIAQALAIFNRLFPFSVGEVFIGALVVWFTGWTIWYLRRATRGETRFFDVIKLLFLHLLWTFATIHAFFLILWGLNFQRMPITDTWRLDRRPARTDELQVIAQRIVTGINRNYAAASEGQDWARTSRLPLTFQRLNQALDNTFQTTALLGPASNGGWSPPKEMRLSRVASSLGICGIFVPFTGEPTINTEIPASEIPFAFANQKAHQRGYARESEANLVAYVICINSAEPYIRYSGFLHAVKVLDDIERAGVGHYKDMIGVGPSADLETRRQFWGTVKNPNVGTISNEMINAYLRLNRVTRGMDNYDEDIPLIIAYYLRGQSRQSQVEELR